MIKLTENKKIRKYDITNVAYAKCKFFYEIEENEKHFEVYIGSNVYGTKKFCWGADKHQGPCGYNDEEIISNYMRKNYVQDIYEYLEEVKIIETYRELFEDIDEIRDDMIVLD